MQGIELAHFCVIHYLNLFLVLCWKGIEGEALKRVMDYSVNMVDGV